MLSSITTLVLVSAEIVIVAGVVTKELDSGDNHLLGNEIILGSNQPRKNKELYFRCIVEYE
jgi:hypothetical protein